jgi:hypothetical protein
MNRITVSDMTANPDLWRGCYWSFHPADGCSDVITAAIIGNRNELATRFELLVRSVAYVPMCYGGKCEVDHPELYKCRDGGLLLVCSNYGGEPPTGLGMVETAPIYSTQCRSYARRFDSLKAYRTAIKQIEVTR